MPVMFLDGLQRKMSCGPCIRGHRSSKCGHENRLLVEVRQPGRPLAKCPHKTHPCSCDRLVVVNYAIPLTKSCPCKARTLLSIQASRAQEEPTDSSLVHTMDCLHNPANVEILSDVVVVNNHASHCSSKTNSPTQGSFPGQSCCSKNEVTPETIKELLSCCRSSDQPKPVKPQQSLLEALQISDTAEPKLVAYYIHNGDTKLCSRVETQRTPQGHLTTRGVKSYQFKLNQAPPPPSLVSHTSAEDGNGSANPSHLLATAPTLPSQYHDLYRPPPVNHPLPTFHNPEPEPARVEIAFPDSVTPDPVPLNPDWLSPVMGSHSHSAPALLQSHDLCMCGDMCSCVGCPQHLNNQATMDYVLYHVAAAEPTGPASFDFDLYSSQATQTSPIPLEWTAYEDAFDFMTEGSVNNSTNSAITYPTHPSTPAPADQSLWLQPSSVSSTLVSPDSNSQGYSLSAAPSPCCLPQQPSFRSIPPISLPATPPPFPSEYPRVPSYASMGSGIGTNSFTVPSSNHPIHSHSHAIPPNRGLSYLPGGGGTLSPPPSQSLPHMMQHTHPPPSLGGFQSVYPSLGYAGHHVQSTGGLPLENDSRLSATVLPVSRNPVTPSLTSQLPPYVDSNLNMTPPHYTYHP